MLFEEINKILDKDFKEKVNKTFYDTVLRNVKEAVSKYTSKLHFFFNKGQKLDLSYSTGGFRPSKFYLVHNTIDPYSGAKGKVTFIYNKNGNWKIDNDSSSNKFIFDLRNMIGESKAQMLINDILDAVRKGMNDHSRILIKDKNARNARINTRNYNHINGNPNQRLEFEEVNYYLS